MSLVVKEEPGQALAEPAKRWDGRLASETRAVSCVRALLQRADGSARWMQDGTCVLASVYGPKRTEGRKEEGQRAVVEVNWKPRCGPPGAVERELELVIRQAAECLILLERHPRTAIAITVQVVEDDGAVVAAALNCVTMALVDAGIPLKGLLVGVELAVMADADIVIDPSRAEEKAAKAVVCLALPAQPVSVLSAGKEGGAGVAGMDVDDAAEEGAVIMSMTRGRMTVEDFFCCLRLAQSARSRVSSIMRLSIASFKGGPTL